MSDFPRRGEVWRVRLSGTKSDKSHTALVVQNDLGNEHSPTILVAPLTRGKAQIYPFEVAVPPPEGGVTKPSLVNLSQIHVVDREQLAECCGRLKEDTMRAVDEAICASLGVERSPVS
jgi:mRNA interferase MazF